MSPLTVAAPLCSFHFSPELELNRGTTCRRLGEASAHSKLYSGDDSLVMLVIDTNHFFWAATALPFTDSFARSNSLLLLDHVNRVVISWRESTRVLAPWILATPALRWCGHLGHLRQDKPQGGVLCSGCARQSRYRRRRWRLLPQRTLWLLDSLWRPRFEVRCLFAVLNCGP